MNKIIITIMLVFGLLSSTSTLAQKFDQIDTYPVDIAYLTTKKIPEPLIKVVYGRPLKTEDAVFGEQIPYGEVWRTGANEATEVKFYSDMLFGNKLVKAGTYVLHTIPGEKEWTIILNSNTDTWGAFFYDGSKDVVRIKVPSTQAKEVNVFSIGFKKNFKNSFMVLAWDSTRIDIPLATGNEILARI